MRNIENEQFGDYLLRRAKDFRIMASEFELQYMALQKSEKDRLVKVKDLSKIGEKDGKTK